MGRFTFNRKIVDRLDQFAELKLLIGIVLSIFILQLLHTFYDFPSIPQLALTSIEMSKEGVLPHDVAVTSARWLIGWSVGAFLGLYLGVLTGRISIVRVSFEGLMTIFRAIPFICLVPLSVRIFGFDEIGKFFIVAWSSATLTWVGIHQATLSIEKETIIRARSLKISNRDILYKVVVPEIKTAIYIALKTTLLVSLLVVAVSELVGTPSRTSELWWSEGLGYRIFDALDRSRDDEMIVAICIFVFLGLLGERFFEVVWSMNSKFLANVKARGVLRTIRSVKVDLNKKGLGWLGHGTSDGLKIDGLSISYGANDTLVEEFSLILSKRETVSIIGKSGVGKTSLLFGIAGIKLRDMTVDGSVHFDEGDTPDLDDFGFVFQSSPVFKGLTVWDNATISSRFVEGNKTDYAEAIAILSEFGLIDKAHLQAEILSGGEKQRLSLATALLSRPKILLLDEPFAALDAITRLKLQRFFVKAIKGKIPALWVTHDLEEALTVGDRVIVGVNHRLDDMPLYSQQIDKDELFDLLLEN